MDAYLSKASNTQSPDASNEDVQGETTGTVTREETQPETENRGILMEMSTDLPRKNPLLHYRYLLRRAPEIPSLMKT